MAKYGQNLSAEHIAADYASYEAARTGFFELTFSDIDNLVRASYSGNSPENATDADKIGPKAQEYLKLNTVSAFVPHFTTNVLSYRRGNEEIKFAGVPTFPAGSITVDDVVGLDTKSILMAWENLVYNVHTRKGGRMVDYKKIGTLTEYTQDYEEVRHWKLYGCWIHDLKEDDFNKENDGKRQISFTLEYDRAEMYLPE